MSEKLKPHTAYRRPGIISRSSGINIPAYADSLTGDKLVEYVFRDASRKHLRNTLKLSKMYVDIGKELNLSMVDAEDFISPEDFVEEIRDNNNPDKI